MANKDENNTPMWKSIFILISTVFIILVVLKYVLKYMEPQTTTVAPFFYDYYEE